MKHLRVLIVEDCVVQRLFASRLLYKSQVTDISYATNGEQALQQLARQQFDVLLIDLEMGIMDGVQLLRHIAQNAWCKNIIIASAKDPLLLNSAATMAEADGLFVAGVLRKPIDAERLTLCLHNVMKFMALPPATATQFNQPLLLKALQEDQISLLYQPIVSSNDHSCVAVEVLARWQLPDKSWISPVNFIPAFERYQLIDELSLLLLDKALRELTAWRGEHRAIKLAFNISPLSLPNIAFIQRFTDILASYGVPADEVILEITEGVDFAQLALSIANLAQLRLKGFSIAIDDYGSGFANPQQLSRVPANRLKLDRSMVDGCHNRKQLQLWILHTVELAKELNLQLVAEGIEAEADANWLASAGIPLLQGYFFAKPLSAAALLQRFS